MFNACMHAKSLQSCPTLCNPIDSCPPGFPIPGILRARTLEWIAISFSNAWKWKVKVKSLSHVRLLATPWTAAYQAPPSMGFSRQEYWSGGAIAFSQRIPLTSVILGGFLPRIAGVNGILLQVVRVVRGTCQLEAKVSLGCLTKGSISSFIFPGDWI